MQWRRVKFVFCFTINKNICPLLFVVFLFNALFFYCYQFYIGTSSHNFSILVKNHLFCCLRICWKINVHVLLNVVLLELNQQSFIDEHSVDANSSLSCVLYTIYLYTSTVSYMKSEEKLWYFNSCCVYEYSCAGTFLFNSVKITKCQADEMNIYPLI